MYKKGENHNNVTNIEDLVRLYTKIRFGYVTSSTSVFSAQIVDFGCGIGNILESFNQFIRNDLTIAKEVECIDMIGIEKITQFADFAGKLVQTDSISHLNIINMDLNSFLDDLRGNLSLKKKYDLRIWFVNDPFNNESLKSHLQTIIAMDAPKKTFIVNPNGFESNSPSLKRLTPEISRKV